MYLCALVLDVDIPPDPTYASFMIAAVFPYSCLLASEDFPDPRAVLADRLADFRQR